MLRDSASPLRILKELGDPDRIVYRGYLASPRGLTSDDAIEITRYSADPWTIYIEASRENLDIPDYIGIIPQYKLDKEGSGSRHFLVSRAKNRKPGIIITASGYEFTGRVQVNPHMHKVEMFHVQGGVEKAFAMHKKRLVCLEIGALYIPEAHKIYKAIVDAVPIIESAILTSGFLEFCEEP